MAKGYYRAHHDMGLSKTIDWLAHWYGDTSDLRIEHVPIICPDIGSLTRSEIEQLGRLRSANQSALHSYLKFAALKWLEENSAYPDTIESEVICYSPVEELCEGVVCTDEHGRAYEIRKPQVLYDNREGFPLSYGISLRLDLHAFDISVEIGATHPFNLLTPLLDGLVDRAVWLPYPWGTDTRSFEHPPGGLGPVRAYQVRFRDAP